MARVFLPLFTVCAFSILVSAESGAVPQTAPLQSGGTAPITIGRAVVPLNGPWKFQIGDSPIDPFTHTPLWAETDFDDSLWETVDLAPKAGVTDPLSGDPRFVPGWTAKGHPGYMGWAWYRLRVPVVGQDGVKLALGGPKEVTESYQLFANGALLGAFGDFVSPSEFPVAYFRLPKVFPLPDPTTSASDREIPVMQTLAFRVWMGPVGLFHYPDAGGLHYAPVIGELSAIETRHQLEWQLLIREEAYGMFETGLVLLLAIVAASLVLFDRSDRVYVWVAGVFLIMAATDFTFLAADPANVVSSRSAFLVLQVFSIPLCLGGWSMVWWTWFQLRRPVWVPKAIVVLTLLYMASEALGGGFFYAIPHTVGVVFSATSLAVRLLFIWLLVLIVVKGVRSQGREGLFVLLALVPMAVEQFQPEMIVLHVPIGWYPFGIRFWTSSIAHLLLFASVALLLLRRLFLSVRRQRQMALDVKQAQEVQQVILPEARTTLRGLVIESEYRPAREVGGDFFQIVPHKSDGSLLIVAGDVTGKGLKAGMLVALLVGAVRSTAELNADPEFVLNALNRRLLGRGDAQATCLALRIANDGAVTLANAGHMAPYLNGEPMAMEGALPLGMVEGAETSVMRFQLKEDDKLVLMSDGIAEATDAEGQLFGFERIHELLRTAGSAAEVATAAQRFGQEDDISVISVTRTAVCEPAAA
jgi:Stage II sporulation protein E (SpoIIE)